MKIHHFNGMKPRKGGDFHGRAVSFREGKALKKHRYTQLLRGTKKFPIPKKSIWGSQTFAQWLVGQVKYFSLRTFLEVHDRKLMVITNHLNRLQKLNHRKVYVFCFFVLEKSRCLAACKLMMSRWWAKSHENHATWIIHFSCLLLRCIENPSSFHIFIYSSFLHLHHHHHHQHRRLPPLTHVHKCQPELQNKMAKP